MKLSELERDLTQVARGREMDAMTAYRAFALHPPVRLPPDESRARPVAPGEPKKYACFSERCCGVLKDSDAFSSNQCRRDREPRQRRCRECIEDNVDLARPNEFGRDVNPAVHQLTIEESLDGRQPAAALVSAIPPASAAAAASSTPHDTAISPGRCCCSTFLFLDLLLELLFSNYFSRTTFLDYYLLYYSINNTSSTVGHGPAAISLLEGSSEPAVNSVAPLSLTPGSRAAECHAPSRADAVLSSPLTARASAVRTAIGPSRVMGRAEVGVSAWNRVQPCPLAVLKG